MKLHILALVLPPILGLATDQGQQLLHTQSAPRRELRTTQEACEPWPEIRCLGENRSATLPGRVHARNGAARLVSVREEDGSENRSAIASVTATADAPTFEFEIPIDTNGHMWCTDRRVEYSMTAYPRRLWVEAPGCRAVKVVCRDECVPEAVDLECS